MRFLWAGSIFLIWSWIVSGPVVFAQDPPDTDTYELVLTTEPATSIKWATFLTSGDLFVCESRAGAKYFKRLNIESGEFVQTVGMARLDAKEEMAALSPDLPGWPPATRRGR